MLIGSLSSLAFFASLNTDYVDLALLMETEYLFSTSLCKTVVLFYSFFFLKSVDDGL